MKPKHIFCLIFYLIKKWGKKKRKWARFGKWAGPNETGLNPIVLNGNVGVGIPKPEVALLLYHSHFSMFITKNSNKP